MTTKPSMNGIDDGTRKDYRARVRRDTVPHFTVTAAPWDETIPDDARQKARPDLQPTARNHLSWGNHRALLRVASAGDAAHMDLEWRRHDRNVADRRFIIVGTATRREVPNIHREEVTNERCRLFFGPVSEGDYYFYYLPFELQGGWGGYGREYLPREAPPDTGWLSRITAPESRSMEAECVEIQARTELDAFHPMEVIATESEKRALMAANPGRKFLLFPEDRENPIRMLDSIPYRWTLEPPTERFSGRAARNEYYPFQIGIWALEDLEDLSVGFSPLRGESFTLPVTAMTCFNTGGIDPSGKPFTKTVDVAAGHVQPLWIGLDLPESIPPGTYTGAVAVGAASAESREIEIVLEVSDVVLSDRGDGDIRRHSRLRWLDSKIGIDDEPIAPYEPIEIRSDELSLTGKKVAFAETGLPAAIRVYGTELLESPIRFAIVTADGEIEFRTAPSVTLKSAPDIVVREVTQENSAMALTTRSEVESDGWHKYFFTIKAAWDIAVSDIRLVLPYRSTCSNLMSGMDLYGAETPERHDAKMDPLYDAFWVGSVKAGLYCELRGASYCGPMLYYGPIRDFYKPVPTVSWDNGGKGSYRIRTNGDRREVIVSSGDRLLEKGERLVFECAFIITPIKQLDTHYELTNRYFQNQYHPEPTDSDAAAGVKVTNLHHANEFNPFINYPFIATRELRGYVERCHRKGILCKIYCTTRELTDSAAELWVLRSLGDEILTGGQGGGYPRLREHLVENYTPQWYQYLGDPHGADAAVLSSVGMTRWYNYYIEGLKWLVENIGIDGLYIDAAAYDREIVKRIRKAMDQVRPGCRLDLHEGHDCILRYLEFFPYLDRIWIGESIDYDRITPAEWLVCVSGIPFGLMSDMLHEGGNPWLGLVYGLTTRYGWTTNQVFCDPRNVWRALDDFGIADATMVGYWDDRPVVATSRPDVLATAYLRKGRMLVAVGSWAERSCEVTLTIDYERVGLERSKVSIVSPGIEDFQPEQTFGLEESITLEPARGRLLVVEER